MRRAVPAAAVLLAAGIMISLGAEEKRKPPPAAKAPPQKATAAQLAADAERAIAFMAKEVAQCKDKSLNLDNVRQQPFFSALHKTEEVVASIQEKMEKHDLSFFESVNEGTQVAAELRSALPRSGIRNAKISEGVKVLSNALTLLRRNYGREAVHRKKNTDTLSEREKEEFTQLKESEVKLVTRLETLAEVVKSNKHLSAELARVIGQLKKSIEGPMTREALDAALELTDVIEGEWEAYSYYVDPKFRDAWADTRKTESFKEIDTLSEKKEKEIEIDDWEFIDEAAQFPASMDVTVDIEIDEVEGYILFVEESVEGIEVTLYYEENDDVEMTDEEYQEIDPDAEMQPEQERDAEPEPRQC